MASLPSMFRAVVRVALVIVLALTSIAHAAPTTVGVDLTQLDGIPPADTSAIEQMLVARLVQDGFAVVPLSGEPAVLLTIVVRDNQLVVAAKSAQFDRSRAVDLGGEEARLELVQKAAELARLAAEAIPPKPRSDRETPAPLVVVPAPVIAEPAWTVGLDAGVLVRSGGTDAELAVRARFAIARAFGVALYASGSRSSENDVDVRELHALVGPSYEYAPGAIGFELALVAGVRQHHFSTAMPIVEPDGNRVDPEVALPVRLAWRPLRALEVSARVTASAAPRREHLLGDAVLWERGSVGVGVAIGVAGRF